MDAGKTVLFLVIVAGLFFAGPLDKYSLDGSESYIYLARNAMGNSKYCDWDLKTDILLKGKLKELPLTENEKDDLIGKYTLENATVVWSIDKGSHEKSNQLCKQVFTLSNSGSDKLENLDLVYVDGDSYRTRDLNDVISFNAVIGKFELLLMKGFESAYYNSPPTYRIETGFYINANGTYVSDCERVLPGTKIVVAQAGVPQTLTESLRYYFMPLKGNYTNGADKITGSLNLVTDSILESMAGIGTNNIYSLDMDNEDFECSEKPSADWSVQWKMVLPKAAILDTGGQDGNEGNGGASGEQDNGNGQNGLCNSNTCVVGANGEAQNISNNSNDGQGVDKKLFLVFSEYQYICYSLIVLVVIMMLVLWYLKTRGQKTQQKPPPANQ